MPYVSFATASFEKAFRQWSSALSRNNLPEGNTRHGERRVPPGRARFLRKNQVRYNRWKEFCYSLTDRYESWKASKKVQRENTL
jgi:hypothetical protein